MQADVRDSGGHVRACVAVSVHSQLQGRAAGAAGWSMACMLEVERLLIEPFGAHAAMSGAHEWGLYEGEL
ncbi:hypothetical protein DCO45_10970 [Comamonas sp. JNW]|nr:hypothetical protein DCO45_10970 [Comamonas sp. JNW]